MNAKAATPTPPARSANGAGRASKIGAMADSPASAGITPLATSPMGPSTPVAMPATIVAVPNAPNARPALACLFCAAACLLSLWSARFSALSLSIICLLVSGICAPDCATTASSLFRF